MPHLEQWKNLSGARLWMVSLSLLAACVLTDQPWKAFASHEDVSLGAEPVRIADSLYRSGEFANPFKASPSGFTAHSAPGFPVLVFWLFKLVGEGPGARITLHFLAILALGSQLALLPWCSRIFGYHPWTGVLAACFGLMAKPLTYELWEAHEAGLLLLILAAAVCYWANHSRTAGVALLAGAIAGLTICFQPVAAPVYLGWVLITAGRQALRDPPAILLWLVPVVVCVPWMVRNQLRLGTFGLRDDLGIELHVSFNDCASYGSLQSRRELCFDRLHPFNNVEQAVAVRTMGEGAYNRDRMRKGLAWIAEHPGRAAGLVAARTWFFWFPADFGWLEYLRQSPSVWMLHALTLVSIGGLWMSVQRRIPSAPFLGLLLAVFPLIYYAVLFNVRYRYPILWVTWLESAYFCAILWERAFGSRQPDPKLRRSSKPGGAAVKRTPARISRRSGGA
jgi:hypothetical protein